jgi:hypothetical protein
MDDVSKEQDPNGEYIAVWFCPICDELEYWDRDEATMEDREDGC